MNRRQFVELYIDQDILVLSRELAHRWGMVWDELVESQLQSILMDEAMKTDNDLVLSLVEESFNNTKPFWEALYQKRAIRQIAGKTYQSLARR